MTEIVWEFDVAASHAAEFEKQYGTGGEWMQLFRRDPAYRGTSLLRDRDQPGRYITIDRWEDLESYEAFRAEYGMEYQEIDKRTAMLTESEKRVGVFESL
jgi:heme-degrading monooxygenase HmoA